jgi:hypothetical protein
MGGTKNNPRVGDESDNVMIFDNTGDGDDGIHSPRDLELIEKARDPKSFKSNTIDNKGKL